MFSQDINFGTPKPTIEDTFNRIKNHCDGGIRTAFVCNYDWANQPNGVLVLDDEPVEQFVEDHRYLRPDDWCLTFDEEGGVFCIGFLFKYEPF